MKIKEKIEEFNKELIDIRRDFHRYPELSENEYRTMDRICRYLDMWDIKYKKGIAKTGVVAIIEGNENGKTIGLRADIDALPIMEDTNLEYKSQYPGVMHACGHDAHISILLGTAKILNSIKNELSGNIKLFFQPAEETIGGAKRMIDEGCLENPYVDIVLGLHMTPNIETGKIKIKYGRMNAASDVITIVIKGKSTHGAFPDKGIDPIIIAANAILALQTLVSRNISPLNSVVFTIGSIHGGNKENIIPDEVNMECILRTLDNETRNYCKSRIIDIVENTSKSYGGEGKVIIHESYAPLINNDDIVDIVKDVAGEVVGEKNIVSMVNPIMGAEDFSYFAEERKACFFRLGCRNEEKGCIHPAHSSKFNLDESSLKVGVEMQVRNALKLLNILNEEC